MDQGYSIPLLWNGKMMKRNGKSWGWKVKHSNDVQKPPHKFSEARNTSSQGQSLDFFGWIRLSVNIFSHLGGTA